MNYFLKFLICLISLLVLSFFVCKYYVKHHLDDLPAYEFFIDPRADVSIKVIDREGRFIGVRGAYYGGRVDYNTVSKHLVNAIIAIEDRDFYNHHGFDPFGILRAMITNFRSGSVVQGASTLTQQLAKDLFLTSQRSYGRKFKELMYSLKLEENYSKNQILTLYLNRVYLGAGLYGVSAAAERYFGKSAQDLNIAESAMIAGLLKAPSRYSPTNSFVKAEKRAAVVVDAMYRSGYITEEQKNDALKSPAKVISSGSSGGGGYVADYAADSVSDLIGDYSEDLVVTVTVDLGLQSISDAMTEYFVKNQGQEYDFSQAAFVAFDDVGRILAMTGGTSYSQSSFNRVVSASRQPGSAFKTFVYAAAFEAGFTPSSMVHDGPVNFGGYKPANYTNKYKGDMSIRSAYVQSINTVAVKLAKQVGIGRVIDMAYRCGIKRKFPRFLSIALGSSEVSLLELTHGYTPFFNHGVVHKRNIIQSIKTASGNVLFELNEENNSGKKEFDGTITDRIKDVMAATVSYGTGTKAAIEGVSVYGKTGTSSNYRDAWFIGHAGKDKGITAGVWVGNDNTASMKKATGGSVAAVLWQNILTNYIKEYRSDLLDVNYQPDPTYMPSIDDQPDLRIPTIEDIIQQDEQSDQQDEQSDQQEFTAEPSDETQTQEIQQEPVIKLPPQAASPDSGIEKPSTSASEPVKSQKSGLEEDKIEDLLKDLDLPQEPKKESLKPQSEKNVKLPVNSVAEEREKVNIKPQGYSEDKIKDLLEHLEN